VLTTFGLRFATFTLTFGFLAEKHGWNARKNAYEALAAKAGRRLCLLLVAWWVIKPVWQRRFVSFVAARLLSFGSARHYPCSCAAAASFNAGGTSPRSLGIPISEKGGGGPKSVARTCSVVSSFRCCRPSPYGRYIRRQPAVITLNKWWWRQR